MKVFSYVVRDDTGFAPNPFHGCCTLACCKPKIRNTAGVGDLVVGLSKRSEGIVYAMLIDRRMTFAEYWSEPAFAAKTADWTARAAIGRVGDKIYEPMPNGECRQLASRHSYEGGMENPSLKRRDLSGRMVLAATHFVYFGGEAQPLPTDLRCLEIGRNHRSEFTREQVAAVEKWFRDQQRGVVAKPAEWPAGDDSWRG